MYLRQWAEVQAVLRGVAAFIAFSSEPYPLSKIFSITFAYNFLLPAHTIPISLE